MSLLFAKEISAETHIFPSNKAIRYLGRIDTENPYEYTFAYPGVTIQAEFRAKQISVIFQDHSPNMDHNYFDIYIDGEFSKTINITNKQKHYTLFASNALESHIIKIVKRTESRLGVVSFFGFSIEGQIENMRITSSKIKMEFIGNSITCGYGIEADSENDPFRGKTQNITKAYAYRTAELLKADAHFVAFSGKGIYRNYGEKPRQSPTLLELHEQIYPQHIKNKWNYYTFIPHIVIINLGSNDFAPPVKINTNEFKNAYIKLIERIRKEYGENCDIYCLNGPMLVGKESKILETCLLEIQEMYKEQGKTNVFYFRLSHQDGSMGFGANWHPSSHQGLINAIELAQYIKDNSL